MMHKMPLAMMLQRMNIQMITAIGLHITIIHPTFKNHLRMKLLMLLHLMMIHLIKMVFQCWIHLMMMHIRKEEAYDNHDLMMLHLGQHAYDTLYPIYIVIQT